MGSRAGGDWKSPGWVRRSRTSAWPSLGCTGLLISVQMLWVPVVADFSCFVLGRKRDKLSLAGAGRKDRVL